MNRRKRSQPFSTALILVPVLMVGCLLLIGIIYIVTSLPRQAYDLYGPASSKLGAFQRVNYSLQLLLNQDKLTKPLDANGNEQLFKVDLGESAAMVAAQLQDRGLIQSSEIFRIYLVYSGLDTGLQAGNYHLSPSSTSIEIARKLQDATPEDVTFRILAGWRIEEIAAALPTSGLSITPDDFLQLAKHYPGISRLEGMPDQVESLEGLLLPGSYTIKRDATNVSFLNILLQAYNQQVNQDSRNGFKRQNLSLYEAVILASIVQKEAVVEEEQPIIASVFLNRLAAKMKLDSDPTVQYALGYNSTQNTWWTNPLTANDLQTQSPYNTYLNAGLPPGPIANPSISALQAVAFPAQTPYYYFRARCDGSGRHLFAATLEEQVKNACP
jgi:UPF0755 protein